jgi:hypothetical protein
MIGGKVPPPRLTTAPYPNRSPSSTAGSSPNSNDGDDDDRQPLTSNNRGVSYQSLSARHGGSFEMVRPAHDSIERQVCSDYHLTFIFVAYIPFDLC